MKMNLLGIVAIVFAVALSAFTSPSKASHKKASGLYWYAITNRTPSQNVPQANATFIQQSDVAPTSLDCTTATVHQCISGFNATQVNTSTNQLNGTQMPAQVASTKP